MHTVDKLFVATKAFIKYNDKILVVRESSKYAEGTNEGKYDVVGGRVEQGQRFDESLLREVKEETGLDVSIEKPFFVNEWRPQKNGETWQIIGIFFICHATTDVVTLSDDHDAYEWIDPKEYSTFPVIENLHPAFEAFLKAR